MKYIMILTTVFLFSAKVFGQIKSYNDPLLPADLVAAIQSLSVEDFDKFKASGEQKVALKKSKITVKYKAKYEDGYIVGLVTTSENGSVLSTDIKLPFKYCCNHNPSHCSKSQDEIRENTRKYNCIWHRADVEN